MNCVMISFFFFFCRNVETAGRRILYLLKQGDQRAYLLHDSNCRFAQDEIPVREDTIVCSHVPQIKTPPNCMLRNAMECFPGNILARAEYIKNWLRSKRGIPCNRAGAYINKYNFRMLVAYNENVGDSIMEAIANTYGPIFL